MSHCDVRWTSHRPLPQPLAEMGHLSIYQIILTKTQSTKIFRWPTHQPLPQRVPSKLPPVGDLHLPVARAPPIVGWDQLWCSSSSSLYFKYPPPGFEEKLFYKTLTIITFLPHKGKYVTTFKLNTVLWYLCLQCWTKLCHPLIVGHKFSVPAAHGVK